jgi:hypothetical protein
LDPVKEAAFIKKHEDLLNQLPADEVVMFGDAVHPTHAGRPVGCWAPKEVLWQWSSGQASGWSTSSWTMPDTIT